MTAFIQVEGRWCVVIANDNTVASGAWWPKTPEKISVMEGRTLAIASYNSKLDDDFEIVTTDPKEREQIEKRMAEVEARIEADIDPYVAARQMDTDEIVRLDELRDWLKVLVEMSYQGVGYRRVKNPRIWSLHDLDVLMNGGRA